MDARRIAATLLVLLLLPQLAFAQSVVGRPRSDAGIARLEQWLRAILLHNTGEIDTAIADVASWNNQELEDLWIDANVLVGLARTGRLIRLVRETAARPQTIQANYDAAQMRRMRTLACTVTGDVASAVCEPRLKELDPTLQALARESNRARVAHDDNYVVRHAALLHMDVAIADPTLLPRPNPEFNRNNAVTSFRVDVSDGQGGNIRAEAMHWQIAYTMLDFVQPGTLNTPAPQLDPMVRSWYIATALWMQASSHYDETHLGRALRLFPDDPDLRFLRACQGEIDASPEVQSAARSLSLPYGYTLGVDAPRDELRDAASDFRRALARRAAWPEAHLRLGRVLAQLGEVNPAEQELRTAMRTQQDEALEYFAALFLGDLFEETGRLDEAAREYGHAAMLRPEAQSPQLALGHLAQRRGNRVDALKQMQPIFSREVPPTGDDHADPWWSYLLYQARQFGDALDALRKPFRHEPS